MAHDDVVRNLYKVKFCWYARAHNKPEFSHAHSMMKCSTDSFRNINIQTFAEVVHTRTLIANKNNTLCRNLQFVQREYALPSNMIIMCADLKRCVKEIVWPAIENEWGIQAYRIFLHTHSVRTAIKKFRIVEKWTMNAYCYLCCCCRHRYECGFAFYAIISLPNCFSAIPKVTSPPDVLSLTTINCIWKWLIFHLCFYAVRTHAKCRCMLCLSLRANGTSKEGKREREKQNANLWKSFSSEMAINILRHLINRQNSIKFYFQERERERLTMGRNGTTMKMLLARTLESKNLKLSERIGKWGEKRRILQNHSQS